MPKPAVRPDSTKDGHTLSNNDMIVHNGNTGGVTNSGSIANQLKNGFNAQAGYWNGATEITSSSAAANTRFLTTLGYRKGGAAFNSAAGSPFDGVNTTSNDILVKYTYYGDAILDGVVNGADYQQIDLGFGAHLTGWSNGDFNYDGAVDGSDYSLIDNAFNQLTATGAGPLAMVATAVSANDTDGIASGPIVNSATSPIAIVTQGKQKFFNKSQVESQVANPGIFNDGNTIDTWHANSGAGDLIDSGSSGGDFLKELRIGSCRIVNPN